ncbi:MAG TPA: AtpZ/AtpI family protein [Acidimicrobiales bacterium]|nr:AtpZ/AtpI family protein [Acidimicrobiales bacterium]
MTSPQGDDSHQPPHQENSNLKDLPGVAAFAAMGTTLAGCLAAGVLLGLYLDHLANFAPWGLLIGIVLGSVAAVASVVTLVRRFL